MNVAQVAEHPSGGVVELQPVRIDPVRWAVEAGTYRAVGGDVLGAGEAAASSPPGPVVATVATGAGRATVAVAGKGAAVEAGHGGHGHLRAGTRSERQPVGAALTNYHYC